MTERLKHPWPTPMGDWRVHAERLYGRHLVPVMVPKAGLVKGAYYVGMSRNATVARWDGAVFWYWRRKWGREFVEDIRHPEDETVFDCFVPVALCEEHEIREIPLEMTS